MGLDKPKVISLADSKRARREGELQRFANEIAVATRVEGLTVEPGVREVVVALRAFGVKCREAVEGYSPETGKKTNREPQTPYVDIGPDISAPPELQTSEGYEMAMEEANRVRLLVLDLLRDFYKERGATYDTALVPAQDDRGIQLRSMAAELWDTLPEDEKGDVLRRYQTELHDFGEFLKEKYLRS
jgi:hypothetical protein